jgi:hypothetical protein
MEGKCMTRAKIVVYDNLFEETNMSKYLSCNISMYKITIDLKMFKNTTI